MNTSKLKYLAFACLTFGVGTVAMRAADVSLTAGDALGSSSFNTAGHWDNLLAPAAGNHYFTANYRLRTPPDGNSYTFGGDSLTANNTPATDGSVGIAFKGTGTTGILTANWILDGGQIYTLNGVNDLLQLAGTLNVTANGGQLWAKQGDMNVLAPMSGTGIVTIPNTDAPTETTRRFVNLLGDNSAFTGKWDVLGKLSIISEASLGGNPAGFAADQLTLDGGILMTTNTFAINDSNRGITLGAGGGTFNVANPDTNTVAALTIASPITGSGLLTKIGGGTLTLSGNNDFSGGVVVTADSQLNLNSATAPGYGAITFNGGSTLLDNTSGSDVTLANGNSMSWYGNVTFLGSSSLDLGSGAATLYADAVVAVSNNNLTIGGGLNGDGNGRSLTKAGAGTLTISYGGYYAGNTLVNEGTLAFTNGAYLSSPTILVASNATMDVASGGGMNLNYAQILTGDGTVVGDISDGSGNDAINPGTGVGTLTINGNLNLYGNGTLNFQLGADTTVGGGVNDLLVVGGQLNLAGATTLNVAGTPSVGTYTLIQYGTFSGDLANLMPPPGYALQNNPTAHTIELVVTHVPASLTWRGDGTVNAWDLAGTANWILAGTNQFFYTGDTVTFDDSGSNTPAITLGADISPASVTVDSSQNYSFSGGGIRTGSLTKDGAGTLVLDDTNTYSGPTVINGGTLQLGDPSGYYAGTAGSVGSGTVTNNASLVVNHTDTLMLGNVINGSGTLSQIGTGATVLSGSNSYSGETIVSSGSLQVANNAALGSTNGGTLVEGSGQLACYGTQTIDENLTLNPADSSNYVLRNGGNQTFVINGTIALNSDSAIQVDNGSTMVFSNEVSGPGALVKNVGGTLTLAASNTFSGGISVNAGTLVLANDNAMGSNSQIVVSSTTGGPGLSGTRVTLSGGVTIPATKSVNLPSSGAGTIRSTIVGTGVGVTNVWAGTITISGDSSGVEANQVGFGVDASSTFVISGPVTTDGTFPGGKINIRGNSTGVGILAGQVTLAPNGQIQVDDGSTWIVASTGNTWGTNRIVNGTLKLGANDALPTASYVTDNSRFDLAGYNQTIAGLNSGCTITNSSATSDSTLSYSSADTSAFTGSIRDGVRKMNLTIAAGTLTLSSAATLNIAKSTITVNSGGVLDLEFAGTNTVAGLVLNGASQAPGVYSAAGSSPYLAGTGYLQVANPIPTTPTNITFSVSGGTLALSWPADYAGWILQSQTNSLSTGLNTNWVDVPGSESITAMNITIDPSKPAVFYRLRYPNP